MDKKKSMTIEIIGWYGMAAILVAYVMVSMDKWNAGDTWYEILNLTGAIGLCIIAFNRKALPPAVLNVIWALVALVSLIR